MKLLKLFGIAAIIAAAPILASAQRALPLATTCPHLLSIDYNREQAVSVTGRVPFPIIGIADGTCGMDMSVVTDSGVGISVKLARHGTPELMALGLMEGAHPSRFSGTLYLSRQTFGHNSFYIALPVTIAPPAVAMAD